MYTMLTAKPGPEKAAEWARTVRSFTQITDDAVTRINRLRNTDKKYDEYRKQFELYKARLLTTLWMLEGSKGKGVSFPDDADDPGVAEREKAYETAELYPDDLESLRLRFFIVNKLLFQNGPMNSYYWKGKQSWLSEPLSKESDRLRKRITLSEKEGKR